MYGTLLRYVSSWDGPRAGVVHMLGGGMSLVMAVMVNNRPDRFIDANTEPGTQAEATRSSTVLTHFKVNLVYNISGYIGSERFFGGPCSVFRPAGFPENSKPLRALRGAASAYCR